MHDCTKSLNPDLNDPSCQFNYLEIMVAERPIALLKIPTMAGRKALN